MTKQTYGKYRRHHLPGGNDVQRVATDMLWNYGRLDQPRPTAQHQGAIQYAQIEELEADTNEDRAFWGEVRARLQQVK